MPAGRPTKLAIDPELQERILDKVRAGSYPERAALACGIAASTHYLWQAKGLEEREHRDNPKNKPRVTWQVYLDYVDALDQAIAEAETNLIERIALGGPGAADLRWILERRFRDRWGAKQPAPAPAASTPSTSGATVTPLQQMAARREQRSVKKTS